LPRITTGSKLSPCVGDTLLSSFGPMEGLATRYAERGRAAHVDVSLWVWAGMPHVFQSNLGRFLAAERSLDAIGDFLRERLGKSVSSGVERRSKEATE
jgi:acetyl esterase/lipase